MSLSLPCESDMTPSERNALIRLASTLQAGSADRRAILGFVRDASKKMMLYQLTPVKGHPPIPPRTEVEVVGEETGFTIYGPKPIGTFYLVKDPASGEIVRVSEFSFKPGALPNARDPLESAFKVLSNILKKYGLKRVNSTRRNGRRLEVTSANRGTIPLKEVRALLSGALGVEPGQGGKFIIPIRTSESEHYMYEVSLGSLNSWLPDATLDWVEMYQTF